MAFSGTHQWITSQVRSIPLKRFFQGISLLVIVLLFLVGIMAARQFQLFHQCREAMIESGQVVFQYTTIKEHITLSLITGDKVDISSLGSELENLSIQVKGLYENIIIPENLKRLLVARADLIGLTVDLRAVQSQHHGTAKLARTLNTINSNLQQFRLSLADHTRMLLLGLQKIIIGLLGLILVAVSSVLFTVNRYFATPILALSQRLNQVLATPDQAVTTLSNLLEAVESLLNKQQPTEKLLSPLTHEKNDREAFARRILLYSYAASGSLAQETTSNIINTLNGVINYTQALADTETNDGSIQERAHLLAATLREEKKIAEQTSEYQRIARKLTKETGHSQLNQILTELKTGLEKSFQTDKITLLLPSDRLPPTQIPDRELWFLLICCCWDGKAILQSHKGASDQWIQISPSINLDQYLNLTFSNSAKTWPEPFAVADTYPWMSATFIQQLLKQYNAGFSIVPLKDKSTSLQLNLPLNLLSS